MNDDSSIAVLAAELRGAVAELRPGDRLPSSRVLMARHQVSPVTVARAIGLLSAEGLVVTRPGSGTYVAERARARGDSGLAFAWQAVPLADRTVDAGGVVALLSPPPDGVIALSGGYLAPELQPVHALATAAARAVRRPGVWERPPLHGLRGLREWFARTAGGDVTAADVTVTGGGQAAVTIALRALLPPGAPLLVESPTYPGAIDSARAAGLRPVPVPVDEDGLRTDLLADAFAASGARAVYCQPTFHNPTGTVLSPARRAQVLDVARAAGAFVIEDDFARHLGIEPPPPSLISADGDGRVVHISSLTKATAPSVRVAAIAARGPVAERIRATQLVDSFFVARPLQEAALELVGSPAWPRHLRTIGEALRRRRDALAAALAAHGLRPAVLPRG
ncbi:PLP-dependent aminotransferase family protein, partial [Actinomadura sp. DC4]|uniref:aminotransferase-like domain-containing protein n=1 Tax=Actinomadura sp. DC4 TaxID=3055069 RepID=UPI0025B1B08B